MPRVITEPCIGVKCKDCMAVCPSECIVEGDEMVFVNPDECTDCGLCEAECPVSAIFPDADVPAQWQDYLATNETEGRRLFAAR